VTPARCRNVKEAGQGFVPKLATEAPVNGGRNEVPCQVSSDAHERRNDLSAVSTADSVKLKWR
jgi:hypothetical protein